MLQYILRRLLASIPVLILVSIIVSALIRIVPGDVVMNMLGESGNVSAKDLALIRHQLGLDRPYYEQYLTWMAGLLRGDMGNSLWTGNPVRDELFRRVPVTMELALLGLPLAILIAIPIGIISATRQDTVSDYSGRLFAIAGLSLPDFWLATLVVVFLAIWFHWLPPRGYISPLESPWDNFQQFFLPAMILGFRLSAVTMRMTRSTMLEVLRQDYIRTAWSKGLRERVVIYRHAVKNAMIPVITLLGRQFSVLLGGTVIIETVFGIPGVGSLTLDAINQRDYTQVQGNVMFLAAIMVLMNLLVDISYGWFDPRIRY